MKSFKRDAVVKSILTSISSLASLWFANMGVGDMAMQQCNEMVGVMHRCNDK